MPNYVEKKVDQVQSIVKFFEDPCQAPWSVYFELALAPAGHVVIELLSFGLDDVVRGYFRPKGLYRRGRTGRLASKLGKYFEIPEIGEMIGSHLPGAETIKARKISSGVRFLWLVDGVLQRILFWWMIADLLTDFLYEWTSAINRTEYCQGLNIGAIVCPVLPNTATPDAWVTIGPDLAHCEKQWGEVGWSGDNGLRLAPGGWYAAAVKTMNLIGVCGGCEMRVLDAEGLVYDHVRSTLNEDGTHSAVVRAAIPKGKVSYVQIRAVGHRPLCSAIIVTEGYITGYAYTR